MTRGAHRQPFAPSRVVVVVAVVVNNIGKTNNTSNNFSLSSLLSRGARVDSAQAFPHFGSGDTLLMMKVRV